MDDVDQVAPRQVVSLLDPTAVGRLAPDDWIGLPRASARFEDPASGRSEEQVLVPASDGPLFATLVEPLGPRREVAFLICHSFAYEQLDLFPLEMAFARAAASTGFPAVYFQARGYADSGGDFEGATPKTHVRDALVVAEWQRRRLGVDQIVPAGARWGAAVALMVARRLCAPGVVLWNPSLDPGAYLDDLIRVFARSRLAAKARPGGATTGPTRDQLLETLASGGEIDLFGYPLTAHCYREAHATEPNEPVGAPPHHGLVVVVNPRTASVAGAAARELRDLGARVRLEHAEGAGRAQFGLGASPAGSRVVANQPLYEDVATRTIRWAEETWPEIGRDTTPRARDAATPEPAGAPSTVREAPVYVRSRGGWLGAVVTMPDAEASVGVVLLAGRARDRTHRNGLWVKTARTLAEEGMVALRLDYPGVGNSTGSPQLFGPKNIPSWAVEDACRFLLERTSVRRLLLVGTCYGARVVLEAANRVPAVTDVALVVAPAGRGPFTDQRVRLRVGRLLHRGPSDDASPGRPARIRDGSPLDAAFVRGLRSFVRRGRVYLLYGDLDVVPHDLHRAIEGLGLPADRCEIEVVPGEIHALRSTSMQVLTGEKVVAWCRRSASAAVGER